MNQGTLVRVGRCMRLFALLFGASGLAWTAVVSEHVASMPLISLLGVPGRCGARWFYDPVLLDFVWQTLAIGLLASLIGLSLEMKRAPLSLGIVLSGGLVALVHSSLGLFVGLGKLDSDCLHRVIRIEGPLITRALVNLDTVTRIERFEDERLVFLHENGEEQSLAIRGLVTHGQDFILEYCGKLDIEVLERE